MPRVVYEDRSCTTCGKTYYGRNNSRFCPECRKARQVKQIADYAMKHRQERLQTWRNRHIKKHPNARHKNSFPWGKKPELDWLNKLKHGERVLPLAIQGLEGSRLEGTIEALANGRPWPAQRGF